MASSPPQTPKRQHRRNPSSTDFSHSHSRNSSSRNSFARPSSAGYSPTTPRSALGFSTRDGSLATELAGFGDSGRADGLGNLADELADAWAEDGEDYEGEEYQEEGGSDMMGQDEGSGFITAASNGSPHARPNGTAHGNRMKATAPRDSGIDVASPPLLPAFSPPLKPATGAAPLQHHHHHQQEQERDTLSPARPLKHRRTRSAYDGSDYGEESDLEPSDGISAGLETRLAAVEGLARRGMEENGSAADHVVSRVVEQLRDLGSQAGVEGGATRLSTAHTALGTHIAHQTRFLTSLTSALLSPLSPPPSPDLIDAVIPLLAAALEDLPRASNAPLYALHALASSTADLLGTLSCLADSLHEGRQVAQLAGRRLRGVRETVAELRREREAAEQGARWIERGGWEDRLRGRECARVCGEVVGGFEEVCDGWRERILRQERVAA